MTIGSIFLGLALLILVGLFIARPLMVPEQRRQRRPSSRQVLLTQKEALLAQIRILDLDFETGKMPEAVYEPQRAKLMAEASAVLQQLDALGGGMQPAQMDAGPAGMDATIEAAIAARRTKKPMPQTSPDAAIESAIAARREKVPTPQAKNGRDSSGRTQFCSQCGQPTDPDDKFCAHCGHRISQTQPA